MKAKQLTLIIFLLIVISCNPLKNVTENSVFSVNAIQADKAYYTKAVLEYHLIQKVLKKYNTLNNNQTIVIAGKDKITGEKVYGCEIKVPQLLSELESGFQYRYYLFDSNNTAALQAFGITDIKTNRKIQYLVIDYIQYKDIKCVNIPTVRYAVGLRSELKFTKINDSISLEGKGSLSKLAAQVELGTAEVNFSLKTIGLTGKPARLNIPQGVSFNVTTYKDFQNSIEFLKNDLEVEEESGDLNVAPEIIPVMDEYRPSVKSSLSAFSKEIIDINIAKDKLKKISNKKLSPDSKTRIREMYDNELDRIFRERQYLDTLHSLVYSSKPYIEALQSAAIDERNKKEAELQYLREKDEVKQSTLFSGFFPGYPKLNKLDGNKLRKLEEIYYSSDALTLYEFNKFLNIIDRNSITDSELMKVIEILTKDPTKVGLTNAANYVESN